MKKRPVVKVDEDGLVVAEFESIEAAARAEYISFSAVWRRCNGELLNPRTLTGYDYRYKEE